MKPVYFTPGPSELYFTINDHIRDALKKGIPSISHRGQAFMDIYRETTKALKELLQLPDNYKILFLSSANEIWERSIQNLVAEQSFHFINGAFSHRYYEIAKSLNKGTLQATCEEGSCIDPGTIKIPKETELISFTHNETSTGASQPLEDLYKTRDSNPEALIAVDAVSSLPFVNLDYSKIDTAYFSVQKCFGLPAGLGVWLVNDRCLNKHEALLTKNKAPGTYHRLDNLIQYAEKNQTPETPNVFALYLLGRVARDMLEKGIEMIRRETEYKAAVLYHSLEEHKMLSPFVEEKKYRSKTVIVAKGKNTNTYRDELSKIKLIVGSGYGTFKNDHIRIANFPTHSKEQVEMLADKLMLIH